MPASSDFGLKLIRVRRIAVPAVLLLAALFLPRSASAQSVFGTVGPRQVSYVGTLTYTANASGLDPATTRYAYFRRRPGGTWIPSINSPNWTSSTSFNWNPTISDVGVWETYVWAKDGYTPPTQNTYGYAAGHNTQPIEVFGPPTVPGPTSVSCAWTSGDNCWVTGDFTASVSASTGGLGSLKYHICRSNDATGWAGCDVHLTFNGGTSITVSGSHLPADGYRRAYYFQSQDSGGAYSGWNTPRYVRVDRYSPAVAATDASDLWYSHRTPTLFANDNGGGASANSGLQDVRYSWNVVLNGSCTSGTSTYSGVKLTAPAGDNVLYACARDNTGRVSHWNGRYRVSPLGLTGSISPSSGSYLGSFTYTATASGGTPSTTRYAFFRRRPGGTWIPDIYAPTWQSGNTFTWYPTSADTGTWETYIWVKDGDTPSTMNTYGYAAGVNTGPITVTGPPTAPGPTTATCAYTASGECWVQGDFTASVTASTGGTGTLVYYICRSNDTTGWGGCDVPLTYSGGTSILVSGTHLPSDSYRRAYYFQSQDSAGAYSGWNTPLYVRVDRYAPAVSATNASDVTWYSYRTATISASDTGSGLVGVRYSWNTALDAGCTTGTATSSGAVLTAPSGDNLLYLCAKDNTGRVGQWSGRYRVSPLGLTCTVSPKPASYLQPVTYTASATGGTPSTYRYAFFRRKGGGAWIPDVNAPNWQAGNTFTWTPTASDVGAWETYVWAKDGDTPPNQNVYGYAAGCNSGPIDIVGAPTVPGPTTVGCAWTAGEDCWVQGDFTASVTASTGGTGSLVYQICRSNDKGAGVFGGCEVNLTLSGGTSILVSGTHLPADGYRRSYWFQARDSAGALSGWNTQRYVRVDRYAPSVSATNASDVDWYYSRTATVSASDAHSGVQSVRYAWNAALDAACTTGTATSIGAVLTAPAGDNTLHLCAKDNTGRVGQWSGRYRIANPLTLASCSISPATGSYVGTFNHSATASGGIPATTRFAFFRRRPGGTWIPAVTAPAWQAANTYPWSLAASDAGTWETYVWVKDESTPPTQNTYGYAAGCNSGLITVVGPPTVPGPTTVACAWTSGEDCWVQGDFTASVTASTGGMGGLVYQICRSNDKGAGVFGGCEVNLTLSGGTSILISGTNLPPDGYRRSYWFQAKDSAGALSGWNTQRYVRVDRQAPTVSATNASDTVSYSSRTATVAASDSGSGVQSVRYSWNTALDAGCTTGTATSAGAALTAPSGDNLLYLCAKDNTGRVGQWSGRYRVSPLTLTGTVTPKPASYLQTVTYQATATGGTASTIQYAFFRRKGGGAWTPDVSTPNWQPSPTFNWSPNESEVGTWETYIWVKDGDTPATMNTYGYAAGFNTGTIDIVGKPTVPGPTTVSCAHTAGEDCWVQGDFTANVTASTGGMGSLVYQICRSNDKGAGVFGGCEENLTLAGGTSILVSGAHLPGDGYRRAYYFQAKDSAGALSGWNTPRYVRVDRQAPTVSADNASDSWFRSRTAVVSASDTGSGIAAVRYNWNTALDAACTAGTATSAGATLTAPNGDNTLHLCAKDNTGRVTQWSGRYKVAPSPTITVTPTPVKSSYLTTLTWTITVTGGVPGTHQYTFVRRKLPDGAWIPDVNTPNWQTGNTFSWKPEETDAGSWSFYFAVKDSLTTPTDNTYGYASGVGAGPVEIVGRPTKPGPTTLTCDWSSPAGECWVWGEEDVTASVAPSTGGMGSLVYQICRSNDTTGFGGCEVNLTLNGGTSIVIPAAELPADGFRRAYWFQAKDSAGALSGWNTPAYLRVDRNGPEVSATNASDQWFTSRTATVTASDDWGGAAANSGLRELKYAWNADFGAACAGGTAVAPGTTLTAPDGDNVLYLCALDNVGWQVVWTGQYRVRTVPAPTITSVSPKIVRQGTETVLTVTGTNLLEATVAIGTEPIEGGVPDQVFPTAELLSIDPSGTSLTVRIDATEAGIKGFYNLAVATEGGDAAGQFRVVGNAPVVDVYTPSQPVQGNVHVLMLGGANLAGADVVPLDPGIKVLDLDNSNDRGLTGLLYVGSDVPGGEYDIRVERPDGASLTLSLNVVGSVAAASVATSELDVPGRTPRPDVPNVYLQEPVSPEDSEIRRMTAESESGGGIESTTAASICGSIRVSDDIWRWSAILLSLNNELGEPLTREALNRLLPGERINFTSLTIAADAVLRYRFFYQWCSGMPTRVSFCVGGGVYYMVPYVGGHGFEFDLCYGNGGGRFQLTPNGRITRHVWSTSGSCLDVDDADPESPSGERSGEIVAHCCDPTDISLQTSGTVWNEEFDVGGKVVEVRPEDCTELNNCSKKIEWRYVKADGTEGLPQTGPVDLVTTPDQRQAKVTVDFKPEGGLFRGSAWSGGESLVTRSGESTNGTTAQVTLTAVESPGPGSATVTTPIYEWEERLQCTAEVAVRISTVEVEVNDTSDENDDMVQLKSAVMPGSAPKTRVRVRLPSPAPNDVQVVITNPDGRLRFPGAADTTKALTLPKSGGWAEFEVSGEQPSLAKDDAVIEVHQDTADGAYLGRQAMTVFHFESQLRLTRGADYALGTINGRYALGANGPAVTFEADATLKPSGLDCSAPPLRDIRIGFVQEGLGERYTYFDDPANPVCLPGNQGKRPRVAAIQAQGAIHQDYVRDAANASYLPVYSQEGQALAVPHGCPGGGTARETDLPNSITDPTRDFPIPDGIGTVTYQFKRMTINDAFRIWSVSFDTATWSIVPLRESEWYLRADSDVTGPQGATVLPDRAPTRAPLSSGPLFNDQSSFTARNFTQGGQVELVCQ